MQQLISTVKVRGSCRTWNFKILFCRAEFEHFSGHLLIVGLGLDPSSSVFRFTTSGLAITRTLLETSPPVFSSLEHHLFGPMACYSTA